jgi:hypothetical protein
MVKVPYSTVIVIIVINDRGFNDGPCLHLSFYGPHGDSTNVHGLHDCRGSHGDSTNVRGFHDDRGSHDRGRDLVLRLRLQL